MLLLLLLGLTAGFLGAQRQRSRSRWLHAERRRRETEFAIARWYSSGWRGDGWYHDYPTAEEHILQIMKEATLIDTDRLSYQIVDLASPEIFKYPFGYVSHPGEVIPFGRRDQ